MFITIRMERDSKGDIICIDFFEYKIHKYNFKLQLIEKNNHKLEIHFDKSMIYYSKPRKTYKFNIQDGNVLSNIMEV